VPPVARLVPACLLLGLFAVAPGRAQDGGAEGPSGEPGDDCGGGAFGTRDDPEIRPPDGAADVARDAPVIARYARADDLGELERLLADDTSAACRELICLFRDDSDRGGGDREPVEGRVSRVDQHTIVFTPGERLSREMRHFALVARPGFERLTRTELEFETSDRLDMEDPELQLGDQPTLVLEDLPPGCDAPVGTVRVGIAIPEAEDDGSHESVEILLYLTRAVGLDGPQLRARAANGRGVSLTFLLSPEEARDTVCIAVLAVDGVGRVAEQHEELCFHPQAGAVFQPGCSVSHNGAVPGGLLVPLAALGLALRRGRRGRHTMAQEGT